MPTWLKKPQDSQLEEGKPGYLHCLTQATPKPTVIWYRNQMLILEVSGVVAGGWGPLPPHCPLHSLLGLSHLRLSPGRWWQGSGAQVPIPMSMLQDSRFEVSKNGTLRINSVEVYDGTWYRCVSSTPAGSIEAQARVQVLGEPVCGTWAGNEGKG